MFLKIDRVTRKVHFQVIQCFQNFEPEVRFNMLELAFGQLFMVLVNY